MCPGTHSDPANTWPSEATPTGATPPPAPAAAAAAPAQTPLELTSAKGHAIKAMLANMKATGHSSEETQAALAQYFLTCPVRGQSGRGRD
jgi:hypothetical protein